MKLEFRRLALAATVAILSSSYMAHAKGIPQDLINVSELQAAGSACAGGRGVKTELDAQNGILTLTFDQLEAQPSEGASIDRKTCTTALAIHLPSRQKLIIEKASLEARAELAANTKATVASEAFFAGQTSKKLQKEVRAGSQAIAQDLLVTGSVKAQSACGQDTILRTNTSLNVNRGQEVSSSVARVKILKLKLSVKKCRK